MTARLSSEKAGPSQREAGGTQLTAITDLMQISCKKTLPNLFGVIIFPQRPLLGQPTITRTGVSAIGEMRFSQDHFWVRLDDETQATIGLTDYLQEKLGEIYGLRLPEEGEEFIKDEPFTMIEAKHERREMKAPISGEVIEVNYEAAEMPEIINEDPLTEGWLVKVEMASGLEFDDLFTEEEYEDHLSEEEDLEED
jgi:glycine cleavage system H protein